MTLMQQPAPRAHDERAAAYSARNDGEYRVIPCAWIVPSAYNPRADFAEAYIAELAASLKEHGQLQPIVVRPLPAVAEGDAGETEDDAPRFELIIGECRWRAAIRSCLGSWKSMSARAAAARVGTSARPRTTRRARPRGGRGSTGRARRARKPRPKFRRNRARVRSSGPEARRAERLGRRCAG